MSEDSQLLLLADGRVVAVVNWLGCQRIGVARVTLHDSAFTLRDEQVEIEIN
jgi:hypothetical protein